MCPMVAGLAATFFRVLRTVPFERSAVIAYLVSDSVEILNVFYGGKDYEALYQGRADEGDDIE